MNSTEFRSLVADFNRRIMKGRYVYLWHGTEGGLSEVLPSDITSKMDILKTLSTVDISACPADEIDRLIKKGIPVGLIDLLNLPKPRILVVINACLLARYRTGIQMYYDNFVGDGTMLVFQVARCNPEVVKLPSFVKFEPQTCFNYLANLVKNDHVIEEEE